MSHTNTTKVLIEVVILIFFAVLFLGLLYNKEYEVCANYATQKQAQRAYNAGAKQLDGDGDKVACEELSVNLIKR